MQQFREGRAAQCVAGTGSQGPSLLRLAALRQREEALGVEAAIGGCLEVLATVAAGRDDDVDFVPGLRDEKAPASRLDTGDRGRLADLPSRAVAVDAADRADPPVVVNAVAARDAADLIAR